MLSTLLKSASSQRQIEYIAESTTQTSTTSTSTIVVSKPTGTIEGDLMIMIGACGSTANTRTWTGDTGWTEVVDQDDFPSLRIAYKIAGASEPSSYTFTINNSTTTGIAASILTYRNAAYDTIGAFTTGTSPLVLPSVSPSANSPVLIAVGARAASGITLGTPTSMTARVTQNDATAPSYKICDQSVSYGATGTRSMSTGSTSDVAGIMFTIKPS